MRKIDKKRLKEILKAKNLTSYEIYNFKLNKYKINQDQILRAAYLYLRKVCGYKATDFYLLKNKFLKFENWQLTQLSKNNLNECRNLILDDLKKMKFEILIENLKTKKIYKSGFKACDHKEAVVLISK